MTGLLVELLRLLFAIEWDFNFQEELQQQGLAMLLTRAEAVCLVAEFERQVIVSTTGFKPSAGRKRRAEASRERAA